MVPFHFLCSNVSPYAFETEWNLTFSTPRLISCRYALSSLLCSSSSSYVERLPLCVGNVESGIRQIVIPPQTSQRYPDAVYVMHKGFFCHIMSEHCHFTTDGPSVPTISRCAVRRKSLEHRTEQAEIPANVRSGMNACHFRWESYLFEVSYGFGG